MSTFNWCLPPPHNKYSSTKQVIKDNGVAFRATLTFGILLLTNDPYKTKGFISLWDLDEPLESYLAVFPFALAIPKTIQKLQVSMCGKEG